MDKKTILVIDDDQMLLEFLEENLTIHGYEAAAFGSPVKALEYLKDNPVDLVLTDVRMNEMTGDEVLSNVLQSYPDSGVIMMTGFGNITHAVRSLQKGAADYITKPFKAKEILYRIERFFEGGLSLSKQRRGPISVEETEEKAPEEFEEKSRDELMEGGTKFIGETPQIKKLLDILPNIAQSEAPVMIQGESGTGKEVFAQLIHLNSNREDKPYVKINCANLPKNLVESSLFGHKKGAFTGAISDQKGAFDNADGGTILLDEITEIDINVQAKLLRVLQENEFYRVGSQDPIQVDVRVIATSNRNIAKAISNESFREDLYYRLNVFPISIPPLRNRREDIPLLCNFFLKEYTDKYNLPEKEIDSELMDYLKSREWKGNVRELENKIHRGVILSQQNKKITIDHIEKNLFSKVDLEVSEEILSDLPLISIEDMELQLIKKALEHTQGNQKEAAKILGITDRTIRNKLKKASAEQDLD